MRLFVVSAWFTDTWCPITSNPPIGYSYLQTNRSRNLYVWVQLAASEQQLRKEVPGSTFLELSSETIDKLIRSCNVNRTPFHINLKVDFNEYVWITEADKSRALEEMVFQSLHWNYWKCKSMFNSINSFGPLEPVILSKVSMKATKEYYANNTRQYPDYIRLSYHIVCNADNV